MASQAKLRAESFQDLWQILSKPLATPEERAAVYLTLANHLKGTDVNQDFVNSLCEQQKMLTQLILNDIVSKTCAQAAIQLLGYCLFTAQFAEACSEDTGRIIGVLCATPYDRAIEKSVITRALWCLSSQNFHSAQVCHNVPRIITLATDIITEHGFGSLAVEALNVYTRIHQQCPKEFGLVVSMWYKGILVLLQCKVAKFQRKALNLAVLFENSISSNLYLLGHLSKELKEKVLSTLLGYMEERGKDPILILNIWSHFVTVLGLALHKHSSFLNEMLRVVEMGFKHKVFLVQVAAYNSWKTLIDNFSLDPDLLTQQRRLKLLLMPLLASAVKERHELVETARLHTWWHLLSKLGNKKRELFNQVCVPFLLFCLGMDPKLDVSKLSTVLADLGSRPAGAVTSAPATLSSHGTAEDRVSLGKENVPRTPQDHAPLSGHLAGQEKTPSGLDGLAASAGKVLSLLASPSPSPSKKKSDRYQSTPKLALVLSGCHAVLQFLGKKEVIQGSLLETDLKTFAVFPQSSVPFDVAQFLFAFLDGALLYMVHYNSEVKGNTVDYLYSCLYSTFINSIRQECTIDTKTSAYLTVLLTDMIHSDATQKHVSINTRMDILSELSDLPPAVTAVISSTHGSFYWMSLVKELMRLGSSEHNTAKFLACWRKLITVATSQGHGGLTGFGHLCDELVKFVECVLQDGSKKHQPVASLCRMWNSLAQKFTTFVKETNQVNQGSSLNPDFSAARHILKFPFLHLFYNVDKMYMCLPQQHLNSAFETWKELYDVMSMHISLIVKDPNCCAELVCSDLYNSYGHNARVDSGQFDKTEIIKFDMYQNAVALALIRILHRLNWGRLKMSAEEGSEGGGGGSRAKEAAAKSIQSLTGLLSWQLATMWDTVQRGPVHIGSLMAPYTLLEAVVFLYNNLPVASLIRSATEMLAQPMASLWHNILEKDQPPVSSQRPHKGPYDLPGRIFSTWKSILTCFQGRYHSPYDSAVLSALSPLLVLTLSSKKQDLVNATLTFWTATFDRVDHLMYPNKLRDIFMQYKKKAQLDLRLPGFEEAGKVPITSVEDSMPALSVPFPEPQAPPQASEPAVVLPHPSPMKGVKGSFLSHSPKRSVPSTPPKSPAAQALDDILARSHSRQAGQTPGSLTGKSPALLSRRRLSLTDDNKADYVAVEAPAKKQRLLTDHQKEKMRERSDSIPVMYNALDPSQDTMPFTAEKSLPDSHSRGGVGQPEVSSTSSTTVQRAPPPASTAAPSRSQVPSSHPAEATDTSAQGGSPAVLSTARNPPPYTKVTTGHVHAISPVPVSARYPDRQPTPRFIGRPTGYPVPAHSTVHAPRADPRITPSQYVAGQHVYDAGSGRIPVPGQQVRSPISSRTRSRLKPGEHLSGRGMVGEADSGVNIVSSQTRDLTSPQITLNSAIPSEATSWAYHRAPRPMGQSGVRPVSISPVMQQRVLSPTSSTRPPPYPGPVSSPSSISPTDQHFIAQQRVHHSQRYHGAGPVVDSTQQMLVLPGPTANTVVFVDRNTGRPVVSSPIPLPHSVPNRSADRVASNDVTWSQLALTRPTVQPIAGHNSPTSVPRTTTPFPPGRYIQVYPGIGNAGSHPQPYVGMQQSPTLSGAPLYSQLPRKLLPKPTVSSPVMARGSGHEHEIGSTRAGITSGGNIRPPAQMRPPPEIRTLLPPEYSQALSRRRANAAPPSLEMSNTTTPRGSINSQPALVRDNSTPPTPPALPVAPPTAPPTVSSALTTAPPTAAPAAPAALSTPAPAAQSSTSDSVRGSAMSPIVIEDLEDPLASVAVNRSSDVPHSLQSAFTEDSHSAVEEERRKEPVEITIPDDTNDSINANGSVISQEEDEGMELSGDTEELTRSKQAQASEDKNSDESASKTNALESHDVVKNPADSGGGDFTSLPETPPSSPSKESCEAESNEPTSDEPVVNNAHEAENMSVAECIVLNEHSEEREAQSSETVECKEGNGMEDFEKESGENAEKAMDMDGIGDAGVGGSRVEGGGDGQSGVEGGGDGQSGVEGGGEGLSGVASVGEDEDGRVGDSNTLAEGETIEECGKSSKPLHNAIEEESAPIMPISAEEGALVDEQSRTDDQIIASEEVSDENGVVEEQTTAKHSEEQVQSSEPCAMEEQVAMNKDSSTEKQSVADGQCIANESTDVSVSPVQTSKVLPILPRTPIQETPADNSTSPRATPGILKHTSQFDTPNSSTSQGRRVQFASNPVVFKPPKEEEAFRTPRHCTISRTRTPMSSRRTLLKSDAPVKMIQVHKPSSSTSNEPIYPSLTGCESPVEEILPSLSPYSRFTHGLVQLVHARNIHTVGNISSLTEQEIKTLPIKSPKVETLKHALKSFQQQLGTKRRASVDSDSLGPPAKTQKRDAGEAEDEMETAGMTTACTGENSVDSESQLSLASQPTGAEVPVMLSTPEDQAILQDSECQESEEMAEDDNVFLETPTADEGDVKDGKSNLPGVPTDADNIREEMEIATEDNAGAARGKVCDSPTMEAGSPEIPLQSSDTSSDVRLQSKIDVTEEDRASVAEGITNGEDVDEGEGMRTEGADKGHGGSLNSDGQEGCGEAQDEPPSSLLHDHSYFSQESKEHSNDVQSTVKLSTMSSGCVDHMYYSMAGVSATGQSSVVSEKDEVPNDLRSKLSSDVRDHSYCRTPEAGQTSVPPEYLPVVSTQSSEVLESQDLFSADHSSTENHNVTHEVCITGSSSYQSSEAEDITAISVGCQVSPQNRDVSTSTDQVDVLDSLRMCIRSALEECSSVWMVQQELLRGLSAVTDKMRESSSDVL